MKTMASIPVAAQIGRAVVERIQILRARGRTPTQIAAELELDIYIVDEVFAWHDLLCSATSADTCPERYHTVGVHTGANAS